MEQNIYNMGTYHMGIDIMPEDDGGYRFFSQL